MQNVDAPTREILNSFELDNPGHTLILPKNIGTNYFDFKRRNTDILSAFQIDPNTTSMEVATEVRNYCFSCSKASSIHFRGMWWRMLRLVVEGLPGWVQFSRPVA